MPLRSARWWLQVCRPGRSRWCCALPPDSAELIGEALTGAGIPHAFEYRRRFADTALGRALVGLLRSVPSDAHGGGEIGDLLAWLRAPGLLERPELADRLEARASRTGVRDAAAARELWEQEHWPLERIDRLREAVRCAGAARACDG